MILSSQVPKGQNLKMKNVFSSPFFIQGPQKITPSLEGHSKQGVIFRRTSRKANTLIQNLSQGFFFLTKGNVSYLENSNFFFPFP